MAAAREQYAATDAGRLYVREVGHGMPIIVVHGGPDFDHEYLLPEMDQLAESFRLVYYDQRGRGRSFSGQTPKAVTMATETEDLDRIREHFRFDTVAVLGHSWGGLLALEYAIRFPHRVSHLILMNTAPVSHSGVVAFQAEVKRRRSPEQSERMSALFADPQYQAGDIETDLEAYRIHFVSTVREPEQLERVVRRLRSAFSRESVIAARAIEDQLYEQTWADDNYDLIPPIRQLRIPSVIIHGDNDFVPIDVAREIATAIPESRFVELADCGHFAYIEQPDRVRTSITALLARD